MAPCGHNSNRRKDDCFDPRVRLGQCSGVPAAVPPPKVIRSAALRPVSIARVLRAAALSLLSAPTFAAAAAPSPWPADAPARLVAFVPFPDVAQSTLTSPPPTLTLFMTPAPRAEDVPDAVQRVGASGALWMRRLAEARLGLRYWDARHRVLHESAIPEPVGPPDAVAEALWLRFQFLVALPPSAGRPWPPPEPALPTLRPELVAALEAPTPDPWPVLPAFIVPPVPSPPAPPPPQGEVEVIVSALPGARRAPLGVAATPDQLADPGRVDDGRGTPDHRDTHVALRFELGLPSPPALGGSLRVMHPIDASSDTFGLAVVGSLGVAAWHPAFADPAAEAAGPAMSPRVEAGLGAAWGVSELRLHVSATAAVEALTVVSADATVEEAFRGALRLGTTIGYTLGPLMPMAGLELMLSPGVLSLRDDATVTVLADRFGAGLVVGLGYAFGR